MCGSWESLSLSERFSGIVWLALCIATVFAHVGMLRAGTLDVPNKYGKRRLLRLACSL